MSKRKKIIIIAVAVTLALVLGLGGLTFANNGDHEETGAHKLIGVGEMGYGTWDGDGGWDQYVEWDTTFIITNPNCDEDLTIEWVALIDSDEDVIYEGTPMDWWDWDGVLSPHEVWVISLSDLLTAPPYGLEQDWYTLEVTWSGARYSWWSGWGKLRPLIGWQKEKCWSYFEWEDDYPSFAISEAEMQLFPSRVRFTPPEWWHPPI